MKKARIGILTSGGDCPGLNAVIRAVVRKAYGAGLEVIGIEDGFEGLLQRRWRKLDNKDVSGILTLGGTILGTTNRGNPFRYPKTSGKDLVFEDRSSQAIQAIERLGLMALICVGGDGSLSIAQDFSKKGVPMIGIPKTIDNDVHGTDITFGFDTAVRIATEGVDRLHTTAESHHRLMILEVMGRSAGWIALNAGVAGGGDVILIPEIPFDTDIIARSIVERRKKGKRFTIIVVAEGAKPVGGTVVIKEIIKESTEPIRLGGISFVLSKDLQEKTGIETRNVVLGHLQRGGSPSSFDRILGSKFGCKAVDMVLSRVFGKMVGVRGNRFVEVPLFMVARGQKRVPHNHVLIQTALSLETCLGVCKL